MNDNPILQIAFWFAFFSAIVWGAEKYAASNRKAAEKAAELAREKEREAQARRDRDAWEAEMERKRAEREARNKQLLKLGDESISLFESIPEHLRLAERHLEQAGVDFAEGAFAPFWDSIERAAKLLGRFDEGIRHINQNSIRYHDVVRQQLADAPREGLLEKTATEVPSFPVSKLGIERLATGTATGERMKLIVREAQRNFHFATIYEQRKTNHILVAGFTNLAQALDQMTSRITDSIGQLATSVDDMSSTLTTSVRAIDSRLEGMEAASARHRELLAEQASARSSRELKAIDMLDNIQRHRRPWP